MKRRGHRRVRQGGSAHASANAAISPSDLALQLFHAGRFGESATLCHRILKGRQDPAALHILAMIASRMGRHDEAIPLFRQVIVALPGYGDAHRNLGISLQALGQWARAKACYARALELNAGDADSLNNLGFILHAEGNPEAAISVLQRALALAPDHPAFLYNLGNAFRSTGDFQSAANQYERAFALRPDFHPTLTRLLYVQYQTCNWRQLDGRNARADQQIHGLAGNDLPLHEEPHANIARCDDQEINLLVAVAASRQIAAQARPSPRLSGGPVGRPDDGRVRIGYLSGNFRVHPKIFLMAGLFRDHDRTRFSIYVYSSSIDDGSHWRNWLRSHCDRFVDISGMPSAEAAGMVAGDQLDVLVDLDGHQAGSRLDVCAFRPASIMVSWIGMPGTTGAEFIDYVIADKVVLPPECNRFFTEKVVYLPNCYLPTHDQHETGPASHSRQELGLPATGVVFCSFNQAYKIEPVMFDVWMRVLNRVPDSVLWLWGHNEWMVANLRRETEVRGICGRRILFGDSLPRDKHLARLKAADVVLDTRMYNGHTTTQDALWVGLPVITLQGRHFASRVSASLLHAVGLPELITHTLDDYENLAVAIGNDPERLADLKARLEPGRRRGALFNSARFVRHLEQAYTQMIDLWRAGQPPQHMEIVEQEAGGSKDEVGRQGA